MSHVRPEPKTPRQQLADCRRGKHDYGPAQNIGGGIVRRVCTGCADVSIDLTGAAAPIDGAMPDPLSDPRRGH